MVVAITRFLINPSDAVWLVHRRVQLLWIGLLTLWVLAVRIGLRRGLLISDAPRLLVLAHPHEIHTVLKAWRRVSHRYHLHFVDPAALLGQLNNFEQPILLSHTQSYVTILLRTLFSTLEMRDFSLVRVLPYLVSSNSSRKGYPTLMDDTY